MSEETGVHEKFKNVFCDECKRKTAEFISKHKSWIVFKPRQLQIEMAKLICNKCRRKAMIKMRG